MAYSRDLKSAARRYLKAAQFLHAHVAAGAQPGCSAVAGYSYGLAGEIAVKELMRNAGIRELSSDRRKDDPYYAHFPTLRTLLSQQVKGRLSGKLLEISNSNKHFQNWDIAMRYAPAKDIKSNWINDWKQSAEALVGSME